LPFFFFDHYVRFLLRLISVITRGFDFVFRDVMDSSLEGSMSGIRERLGALNDYLKANADAIALAISCRPLTAEAHQFT
jgi:hypothetical protein